MIIEHYKIFVSSRNKPGDNILNEMDAEKANIAHAAMGIGSEAGEIMTTVKRHFAYNQPLDRVNIKEELGDLLYFMQMLMNATDMTLEQVMMENMAKLEKRYPQGYSDQAAKDRADKQ